MSNKETKLENTNKNDNENNTNQSSNNSSRNTTRTREASPSQSDISTRSKSRRISASHKRYKEKRTAYRIIHRLEPIPEEQRNDRQKASLEWAKSVAQGNANPDQMIKRPDYILSDDEDADGFVEGLDIATLDLVAAKRSKIESTQETVNTNVLAIVDRSVSDGSITMAKWQKIEIALLNKFFPIMKEYPGEPPCCRDAGWYEDRIKLICCGEERSVGLLKTALSRLQDLWPDARLDAIPSNQIPMKPRAFGEIPVEPFDITVILNLLKVSNPQLNVENWRILSVSEPLNLRRSLLMAIDNESIPLLVNMNGILNYGFSSIKLQIIISKGFGVLHKYGDIVIAQEMNTPSGSFNLANDV